MRNGLGTLNDSTVLGGSEFFLRKNAGRVPALRRGWLMVAVVLGTVAGVFAAGVPGTQPAGVVGAATEAGEKRVALVFGGGYETVGEDRGRPVVLIAAGLGIAPEVFRAVFKGVHPAGVGSGGPTEGEARANKQVLMEGLGKYGVTDERLNEVSNYYRYRRSAGELWKHVAAEGYAVVKEGKVTGVVVTKGGAGYSSAPTVNVEGMPGVKVAAAVGYGKELGTNGAVGKVEVVGASNL